MLTDHHDFSGVVIEDLAAAICDDNHMFEADAGDPMLPFQALIGDDHPLFKGLGCFSDHCRFTFGNYYAYKLMSEKMGQCNLGTAKIVSTGVPNTVVVSIEKKSGKMLYVAWSDAPAAAAGPPIQGADGNIPPVVAEGSMPSIVAQNPSVEIFVGAENVNVTNSVPDSAGNIETETKGTENGTLKLELGSVPVYVEPI